jgi:hypothetical protein
MLDYMHINHELIRLLRIKSKTPPSPRRGRGTPTSKSFKPRATHPSHITFL